MTTQRQYRFTFKVSAFTLVEVLFASVLMVVLAALVLYMSNDLIYSWRGATDDYAQGMEADIVLDYLADDLSGAFFRNDGNTWLISDQGPSQTATDNTLWLRFFTPARDRDRSRSGDLNAVSYRLYPIKPLSGSSTPEGIFSLFRMVVEADESFREIQGNLENLEESRFHDFSDSRAVEESFLLGNIVSFKVRFYTRGLNPDGIWERHEIVGQSVGFPRPAALRPTYAEIALTVLSPRAAQLLATAEEGLHPSLEAKKIIETNGQTYSRFVHLPGDPL